MAQKLTLSKDLSLPLEAVTETFGLLAARGAGKSNAARVLAEEMHAAGLHFVAVDPVGAWFGLRSSRDGKSPGLAIPILGGKRGDVPLERSGGQLVADLIVDQRISCVLDVSGFDSEAAKKAFLLDFARRLYQRNEEPLHLFLEEADDYIPQRPMRDEAQLLRAWENIVRRGRARGLGMTLITQRSAAINKSVLTQVQTLIAMRTTGPQDRAAIEEWLKYHDQSREILASLAGLESGEAWVWSPQFLGRTVRTRFRLSSTLDSGATPKVGRERRAPATLADVDLGALRERMAATIEKAKAEDPKALRARIAELERQLAMRGKSATDPDALARAREEGAVAVRKLVRRNAIKADGRLNTARDLLAKARAMMEEVQPFLLTTDTLAPEGGVSDNNPTPAAQLPRPQGGISVLPTARRAAPSGGLGAERKVLAVLASRAPVRLTRAQLGTLCGLAHRGGTFGTYLSRLRTGGLIAEEGDLISSTPEGLAAVGGIPPAPSSPAEVQAMWKNALGPGAAGRLLDALVEAYPRWLSREHLAAAVGLTAGAGTFGTYLSRCRSNGLLEERGGEVRAAAGLIEEP